MLPTAVAEGVPALSSLPSHGWLGTPGSPLPPCPAVGKRVRELCWGARSWVPPMWGAADHHEAWAAFAQLPKWCFPPTQLQAKPREGSLGGRGRDRGPQKMPTLLQRPTRQRPQPQGQPGPATLLPGTKRVIEGHSGALSTLCPPGRGRLPSAGSPGPALATQPQHPGRLGAPMGTVAQGTPTGAVASRGRGAPKGAGSICCSPGAMPVTWGPHSCAHLSAVPPRESRGWGKRPQNSIKSGGGTLSLGAPQGCKSVPGMGSPLFPTGRCWGVGEVTEGHHCRLVGLVSHGARGGPQSHRQEDTP